MGSEYKEYLAAEILSEERIVTYRLLSRALKVQSNAAKKMLYEFHRQQNSKKPGSVHATYLLTGTQIVTSSSDAMNGVADGDGDITMQSSPYMSSPIHSEKPPEEPLKQQVITLAREEHLDAVKKKYAEISSIHMYSLGPSTIKNLQILSNVTQGIVAEFASEDPLVHNKTYGVIQNPNVKRRTGARPPIPVPVARAPPKASHGSQKQTTKFTSKESTPALSTQTKPKQEGKNEPMAKSSKSPPVPVKREKSDLFKAFAKSQPKVRREDTGSSVASREASRPETPDDQQDAVMDDDSEEEELERLATNQESTALRDARLTREAKLKKMMEDDEDELMGDATEKQEDEDAEEEAEPEALDAPKSQKSEEEQPTVSVSGGRRRGRRKVMKKKTTKDAEGYLVTKEEPVWESFSEEEPAPLPKPKSLPSSSAAKGKKSAGKPGQGNITSFFGKR